jgi:hypothetical protein
VNDKLLEAWTPASMVSAMTGEAVVTKGSPMKLRNLDVVNVVLNRTASRKETESGVYPSGLRGLEVTFPPLDPNDAGSNPEVVEFLRTEKFRERSPPGGTLSRLTRVVDLLHVKGPHVPEGNIWAKLVRILPVQRS